MCHYAWLFKSVVSGDQTQIPLFVQQVPYLHKLSPGPVNHTESQRCWEGQGTEKSDLKRDAGRLIAPILSQNSRILGPLCLAIFPGGNLRSSAFRAALSSIGHQEMSKRGQ